MVKTIDGVAVVTDLQDFTTDEGRRYIEYVKSRVEGNVTGVTVTASADGKVDVEYQINNQPFHRLRRITGYLTSDLRSWNDAKQAEERERLKHDVERAGNDNEGKNLRDMRQNF